MTTPKLAAAVEENAEKLVDMNEVSEEGIKAYKNQLGMLKLARIFAEMAKPKRIAAVTEATLAASSQLFQGTNGHIYATVKTLQGVSDAAPSGLPEDLKAKMEDIDADVIRNAKDYSGQRQALGLKPAM